MTSLYDKYGKEGFTILAFPTSQFHQELDTNAEIKKFTEKFDAQYPIMAKIDVNGPKAHPVYQWLKEQAPGDISWNFSSRFLIGRDGKLVKRFNGKGVNEKELLPFLSEALKVSPAQRKRQKSNEGGEEDEGDC
jgi:glutathione peroxidase-family protein